MFNLRNKDFSTSFTGKRTIKKLVKFHFKTAMLILNVLFFITFRP